MRSASAKDRVAKVAATQFGRISAVQLAAVEIDRATVVRWVRVGYLHPKLPRVYAVGHPGESMEARLMEAVLYAGPGAMVSHYSAVWWWELDDRRPAAIDVSTPRRCRPLPGVRVHPRRCLTRTRHRGLPVTTVAQSLLDYAASAHPTRLRRALANADYRRVLNLDELDAVLGQGRPGSAKLARALKRHRPQLARSRSDLEVDMFELCQRAGLPLPKVNVNVLGWTVDFLWRDAGVAVEVDGLGNHRSPAQVRRDRRMDLELRTRGLTVLRYSDEQVEHERAAIKAELQAAVRPTRPEPSA